MTDIPGSVGAPARLRGVWWLSPAGAVTLVVPLTLLLAVLLDDSYFRRTWGTPKALTGETAVLFAAGFGALLTGALWPQLGRRVRQQADEWPPREARTSPVLRAAAIWLFRITMVGYLTLAIVGVARGVSLADFVRAVTEQDNYGSNLRAQFSGIAGISTLTQVGIAFVVVAVILLTGGADRGIIVRLSVIIALAFVRAFFLGERLAMIELMIPAATVLCLRGAGSASRRTRLAVRIAPLLLVPSVMVAFGAFEYSRSWVYYSQTTQGSFADFTVSRLAGYYATAYNNGQLGLNDADERIAASTRVRVPYGSVEAIWTAPFISQAGVYARLSGTTQPDDYAALLVQKGNPEFNSPGGLSIPFQDYGTTGGVAFFFLLGSGLGLLYRRCCEGRLWAVLVYPALVTGLFELPRYLYFGQGRLAPAVLALLVVAVAVSSRGRSTSGRGADSSGQHSHGREKVVVGSSGV